MSAKAVDYKEIMVRFIMGGAAVVVCYVVSLFSPVKFIGGVFAAFPAVMTAAVMMAGLRDGRHEAGQVARGAVSGMIGCSACVFSALFLIRYFNSWFLGLFGSVVVWFIAAMFSNLIVSGRQNLRQEAD